MRRGQFYIQQVLRETWDVIHEITEQANMLLIILQWSLNLNNLERQYLGHHKKRRSTTFVDVMANLNENYPTQACKGDFIESVLFCFYKIKMHSIFPIYYYNFSITHTLFINLWYLEKSTKKKKKEIGTSQNEFINDINKLIKNEVLFL